MSSLALATGHAVHAVRHSVGQPVYTWGRGEDGQLGLGDTSDQYKPVLIEMLTARAVVQIACGSGHTVVLTEEGEVLTWGRGDDGRLGHGDNGWKYVPRVVEELAGKQIRQVTCGSYHTAAVTDTGELYTWGGGMYGKLGHGNENGHSRPCLVDALRGVDIMQVACGSRHTVALAAKGDVYTWGDQENGVCGHGEGEGHQYLPRLVSAISDQSCKQIAACGFHTAVLTREGRVFSWGEGKFGRLGHGDEENRLVPALVEALSGVRVRQVTCGGFHTAAVAENGRLWTWGGGEHGQLGHGDKVNKVAPCMIAALEDQVLVQITCGWSHTVALSDKGEVYTWGNGDHGKLGYGDTVKVTLPKVVEALAHVRVTCIASYNEHTAALADPDPSLESTSITSSFAADLRSLVNNADFSDVTFMVEGKPLYAHRAFLAARSDHFRAMFNSGMKESREAEVALPGLSYSTFLSLLEFVYTDSVRVDPEEAIALHVAADAYTMDRLKLLCETRVAKGIKVHNAARLLAATETHGPAGGGGGGGGGGAGGGIGMAMAMGGDMRMREVCMEFVVAHFDAVSKTDDFEELSRELIIEILKNR